MVATAAAEPSDDELTRLRALLIDGRTLDVFAACSAYAPFEAWRSHDGASLAASLVGDLGAPKRALALRLAAVRRGAPSAARDVLRVTLRFVFRGPVDALGAIREARASATYEGATDDDRANLFELEGLALGALRDFDAARRALTLAEPFESKPQALSFARARIALAQDRYDEALAEARRAHEAHRKHPGAALLLAHLYEIRGATDDALSLLRATAETTQSADVAGALATLLEDRKLWDERAFWVEQWAARSPLLEDPHRLTGMRADAAYDRGDHKSALALARTVPAGFHARVAEHLAAAEAGAPAKRVMLDVPFVRQHHMTCAPATLSAIATYWGMRAEHLEVANAICYDGTPSHSERTWAETNGFAVRGFTATWDSVRALLDRGVPMTVVTATAASAHLQAIVGYDEHRGTLFLRDPFIPRTIEALAVEWLATWQATGPLAMAMAPESERSRLDGVVLPDARLHDLAYATNAALARHDRVAGVAARDALVAEGPDHRLAIAARRAVAAYDQDVEGVLACAQALAARWPDFSAARIDAQWCLRAVRPRRDALAASEALYAAHRTESLYAEELARDLATDAREHPRASRLLRKAMAARPDRHGPVRQLADVRWSQRAFDDALRLHRIAACLGQADEDAAWGYFEAARALGRTDEAVAHLRGRHEALGPRNAQPSMTLSKALDALGQADEGFRVLDDALAAHPADGVLLLFVAEARASFGDVDGGRALVARARPFAKEAAWLHAAAHIALHAGDAKEREGLLARLIALEPLNVKAHYAYATSLSSTAGVAAARAHLEAAWTKAPHHRGLAQACLLAVRAAGPRELEATARKALDRDVADASAHLALARALVAAGRIEEARASIDSAALLEPHSAAVDLARFAVLHRAGDAAGARAALFRALALEPDRPGLIAELLAAHGNGAERDAALEGAFRVVARASVTGDGIAAYVACAEQSRDPKALLATVEQLRAERPAIAATWLCAVRQRTRCGDDDGAKALADDACARFPLVANVFAARAHAYSAAGGDVEALLALERAVELALLDEGHVLALANALRHAGLEARARETLTRAIGRVPSSAALRRELAELEWASGHEADARLALEGALALSPDENASYVLLDRMDSSHSGVARDRERDPTLARLEALAQERPWSADLFVTLARTHARRSDGAAAIVALKRALDADPMMLEAHELHATFLAIVGRLDEALEASSPAALAFDMPRELRGRRAWVLARMGNRAEAIAVMRTLVSEHPGYLWGAQELARWLLEDGSPIEALGVLKESAATRPDSAAAHVQLAFGLLEVGDRVGAKSAFIRAASLDRRDVTAHDGLFDLALDDGDVAAARDAIEAIRARSGEDSALATVHQGRLAASMGDGPGAIAALRRAALDANVPIAIFDGLRRDCITAGFGVLADEAFAELLFEPKAIAEVGVYWAATRVAVGELPRIGTAISAMGPRSSENPTLPAVAAAAFQWLGHLRASDARERYRAAYVLSKNLGPVDDALWGEVGAAFAASGASEDTVRWMRDWRTRPNASAQALSHLAHALRDSSRADLALEVTLHGAAIEPAGNEVNPLRTWAAYELAMRGRPDEAAPWLDRTGNLTAQPNLLTLFYLSRAVVVASSPALSRFVAFQRASTLLALAKNSSSQAFLDEAHARATYRIGLELGIFLAPFFRFRERLTTILVTLVVVALVAFNAAAFGAVLEKMGYPIIMVSIFAIRWAISRKTKGAS